MKYPAGIGCSIDRTSDTAEAFKYSRDQFIKAVEALSPRNSRLGTNGQVRLEYMATLFVNQHISFSLEQQAEFNKLSARIPRQYKYVGNLIAGATLTTPVLGGSYITVVDAMLRRKQRLI